MVSSVAHQCFQDQLFFVVYFQFEVRIVTVFVEVVVGYRYIHPGRTNCLIVLLIRIAAVPREHYMGAL